MTIEETKKVMAYIAATYPRYFSGITKETAGRQAIPWHDALKEYSMGLVIAGVKSYISADSSGYPPAPGQIIAYIHATAPDTAVSAQEAWAMVRKAVNVPWEKMQESYDSLPKVVQKAVGSAASLKELAQMDIATFESVAGSNFLRTYAALAKREEKQERMPTIPGEIRERIAAELESRRMARKIADSRSVREMNTHGMALLESAPEPAPEAPDPPEREQVSGEAITERMEALKKRLGAVS